MSPQSVYFIYRVISSCKLSALFVCIFGYFYCLMVVAAKVGPLMRRWRKNVGFDNSFFFSLITPKLTQKLMDLIFFVLSDLLMLVSEIIEKHHIKFMDTLSESRKEKFFFFHMTNMDFQLTNYFYFFPSIFSLFLKLKYIKKIIKKKKKRE